MAVELEKLSEEVRRLVLASPLLDHKPVKTREHKYDAQPTWYQGRKYPSKAQAEYAKQLGLMVLSHRIPGYLEEVWIRLGPDFRTRVDFIVPWDGELQAHEVKGRETSGFRKVRELWPKYAWMPMYIIKGKKIEVIEGKK